MFPTFTAAFATSCPRRWSRRSCSKHRSICSGCTSRSLQATRRCTAPLEESWDSCCGSTSARRSCFSARNSRGSIVTAARGSCEGNGARPARDRRPALLRGGGLRRLRGLVVVSVRAGDAGGAAASGGRVAGSLPPLVRHFRAGRDAGEGPRRGDLYRGAQSRPAALGSRARGARVSKALSGRTRRWHGAAAIPGAGPRDGLGAPVRGAREGDGVRRRGPPVGTRRAFLADSGGAVRRVPEARLGEDRLDAGGRPRRRRAFGLPNAHAGDGHGCRREEAIPLVLVEDGTRGDADPAAGAGAGEERRGAARAASVTRELIDRRLHVAP